MGPRLRPRLMAAVIAPMALLLSLLAWGASSPPGSSPDDDYHMASIWCAGGIVEGQCEATEAPEYRRLPNDVVKAAACFVFDADQSASCPLYEDQTRNTKRGNWASHSYPPVFYAVMNVFVVDDLSASIVMMRSFNALLYVGLLTALFFLLPVRRRPVLVWGSLLSAIPLGMFLIPSVNPSSWAVLSATGLWLAAWGYFEQVGVRKWLLAGMAALFLVIGAGARSDSAVYGVLALIVAVVLAFRRDRRFALDLLLPAALAIVAVLFFFSSGQSAIVSSGTSVDNNEFSLSALTFVNAKLLPQLWAGVFGLWGLGWLDTTMPGIVWVTTLTAFAALVFWGLRVGALRKWIAVAGVAASLVVVPMYILLHDGVVVGSDVQPRYIYPIIIILGGVALVGFLRANLGLGRLQLIVIGAGLIIANSIAMHVNMRRYITGVDFHNFNLNSYIEWWWGAPISPMAVWFGGSLVFAIAIAALAWLVWPSRDEAAAVERQLSESSTL